MRENLLDCHGYKFSCNLYNKPCKGKITVEDGMVYLCQNLENGSRCNTLHGFQYSWVVGVGTKSDFNANNVTNFELLNDTLFVEDTTSKLIREAALKEAKIAFKEDVYIDVYINAFEQGAEWMKQLRTK